MKRKRMGQMVLRSSIIVILALVGIFYNPFGKSDIDPTQKEFYTLKAVMAFLDKVHFSPKSVDDDLSKEIFDNYVAALDPGKRFFIEEDIEKLKAYQVDIDDEIEEGTFAFFDLSQILISASIAKSQSFYEDAISSPIDVHSNETFDPDYEHRSFTANDEELEELWKKIVHFEVVKKVYSKLKAQEDDEEKKSIEELKIAAIEDVKETFDEYFSRVSKLRRSDHFEDYLNAITATHDPHTNYFSPKDKEDFNINMNGSYEGIGARLTPEGEYLRVSQIMPGGPAWKGKELEENDLILLVGQEGEDPLDVRGWRQDDVISKIRGKKGTEVTLTVKKTDGSIADVVIERDEIVLEEGKAQAKILELDGEIDKIGYINLPKFYFEDGSTSGCAEDVSNLITKLENNNVQGIILDLRNNSGGSLSEVVDMSGLFIEKGPIVQVKSRERQPYVLRDKDPSVHYSGPLIVMVNHFSASASEIIAAALQDYKRAIIVGSSSTFGKGTVQRFHALDKSIIGNNDIKPLGEVKITTQKFYRVNGGSTQLRGVKPDIVLPDSYNYIEIGERNYESSLNWSEIDPVDYSQDVYTNKNIELLQQYSQERVSKNPVFQLIDEKAHMIKEREDEQIYYPLNVEKYESLLAERKQKTEKFENILEVIPNLVISNIPEDQSFIDEDDARKARYENLEKSLEKDVYIDEVLHIMKDMLMQT